MKQQYEKGTIGYYAIAIAMYSKPHPHIITEESRLRILSKLEKEVKERIK